MSFLYHKKTQKVVQVIWAVVAVIVTLGMVIAFSPGIANLFLR